MGAKTNFFREKQVWSEIKDELLRAYLTPYLAKITKSRKPVLLADCFAGQGRFDDGKEGSPMIFQGACQKQLDDPSNTAKINVVFIEKKYAQELRKNISVADWVYVLDGDYEERMKFFIQEYDARNKNLFLYVDPYGIKSIRFAHFKEVCGKGANSVELLLNLNAFGFLREGFRLMGKELKNESEEPLKYEIDVNSPAMLDEVAGGEYWRTIIMDKYAAKISMADAEARFAKHYCKKLRTVFKYVINIPIKAKLSHIPKYRMVFGTNHEDGLLLMAENMKRRWEDLKIQSRGDESYLFEVDFPDLIGEAVYWNVEKSVLSVLCDETDLKMLLVGLVQKYGISASLTEYKQCLKNLEKDGRIIVKRIPELTPTGKPCRSWDHMSNTLTIKILKGKQWQQNLL